MSRPKPTTLVLLLAYCLFIRVLPFALSLGGMDISRVGFYPWTFTPAFAFGLFTVGAVKDPRLAFGLPFLLQLAGDAAIGLFAVAQHGLSRGLEFAIYPGQAYTYVALAVVCAMGLHIRQRRNWLTIGVAALISPALFYLVSNAGSWITDADQIYSNDFAGLLASLEAGLPFLKYAIPSTVAYAAIFFSPLCLNAPEPEFAAEHAAERGTM